MDLAVVALLCFLGGISTGFVLGSRKVSRGTPLKIAPRANTTGIYDRSDKVLAAEERMRKGTPDASPKIGTSMGRGRVTYDVQAPHS